MARAKHAEAAACHERAVALQPRDPTALNGLGVSRLGQLRYLEARDCFAQVLRLAPNHALAIYNLGVLEHRCGQPA